MGRKINKVAYKVNKANAGGHCELCQKEAPFFNKNGRPYLEIHRISSSYVGNEPEKNLIALCPNCNARIAINPSEADLNKMRKIASEHTI
ncbi:MAG: hypothetical protein K5662_01370 [Lachnospiraceae bacterium]|nr:hypothetical protein [Lachnospiraceae bacterium]